MHRRRSPERGAAVVETAIVALLFFGLVFGLIEAGLIFRGYLTITNMSRDGARVASAADNPGFVDWQVLDTVRKSSAALPNRDILWIVVFKGSKTEGVRSPLPAGCNNRDAAGNPAPIATSGACNVYTAADLEIARTAFALPTYTKDDFWPGQSRDGNLGGFGADAGTDYVGVYVVARTQSVTGAIPVPDQLASTTIMRIEPKEST